jgi:hypothetical protein
MKNNQSNKDKVKERKDAAAIFSKLSPDAQDAIIDLIKCLLSEK